MLLLRNDRKPGKRQRQGSKCKQLFSKSCQRIQQSLPVSRFSKPGPSGYTATPAPATLWLSTLIQIRQDRYELSKEATERGRKPNRMRRGKRRSSARIIAERHHPQTHRFHGDGIAFHRATAHPLVCDCYFVVIRMTNIGPEKRAVAGKQSLLQRLPVVYRMGSAPGASICVTRRCGQKWQHEEPDQ